MLSVLVDNPKDRDDSDAISACYSMKAGSRRYAVVDSFVVERKGNKGKVIDIKDYFYIMYPNKTFVRNDPKMIELTGRNVGAFRAESIQTLNTPHTDFSRFQSPLTPEVNYKMPWTTVIPTTDLLEYAEFMTINSDGLGFSLWTKLSGELGPYKTHLFTAVVPDGAYNGYVVYQASVMLQDDFNVMYMCYQLGGHDDNNATITRPIHFKVVSYLPIGSQKETIGSSVPIVVKRYGIMPGTFFRKFNIKVADGYTTKLFMYQHTGSTPGQLYEVTTAKDTGSAIFTLVLEAGNVGAITTNRHTNYYMDIFSAPESLFWYVIKVCADVSTAAQGGSYGVNIGFYSGTSLSVEKRLKSDWSLIETYNLTPASCDRELQGLSIAAQVQNSDTGTAFSHPSPDALTRFLPICVDASRVSSTGVVSGLAPQIAGSVLIADDGTEYPLLAVNVITQDRFFDTVQARSDYLANPTTGTTGWGTLNQAAMLWLGGTGAGKTWPGVNAIGLQITEFPTGVTSGKNIGQFESFIREPIAEKQVLYHQLEAYDIHNIGLDFYAQQKNSSNIDGVHYANQPTTITVANSAGTLAGDTFSVELSNGVDNTEDVSITYTAGGNISNAEIASAVLQLILSAGYAATVSSNVITVGVTSSGYVTVECTASRPSTEQTRQDYFVIAKVTGNNGVKLALNNLQHKTREHFLFELEIKGE